MGGDLETAPLLQVENLHTYFMTERGLVRAVEGVSFILAQGVTPELVGGPAALVQCQRFLGLAI